MKTKEEAIAKARELVDAAEKNEEMSLVVFTHHRNESEYRIEQISAASPIACAALVERLMENPIVREIVDIKMAMTCLADDDRVEPVEQ